MKRQTIPSATVGEVMDKTSGVCECCGNSSNLEIHHIIPYSINQDNSTENLAVMCGMCHHGYHKWYDNKEAYAGSFNNYKSRGGIRTILLKGRLFDLCLENKIDIAEANRSLETLLSATKELNVGNYLANLPLQEEE
jgi:hypothetical protein